MTRAPKPASAPYVPNNPLHYLMRTSEAERKRWGARAVELGFPEGQLYTDPRIDALMPWRNVVAEEMRQEGLWAPVGQALVAQVVEATHLPVCPATVRAVPNSILRSALFAAIQGKTRRHLNKEVISSVDGVVIKFKGDQLDQADMDVWEQAVHLTKLQDIDSVCHFRAHDFLKQIGRGTGSGQYEWLHESIDRLISGLVEIRRGEVVFTGGLIRECVRNDTTGDYAMTLGRNMLALYSKNDWTGIEWEHRQSLLRKPLAQWLHNYYASHAKPYPIKVETLRNLCGSDNKILRSFRGHLRKALDDLKGCGAISSWQIDQKSDLLTVDRGAAITESQARHLTKIQKQLPKSNK